MMLRRSKQDAAGRSVAGILLLVSAIAFVGLSGRVLLAQLDLSVFQKEGASEEEQSSDRFECHRFAVQQTGFDPAIRPPDDHPPMRPEDKAELQARQSVERRKQQLKYNEVLKRCMKNRGYAIAEH
jgi:hypothetical protein